MGGKGVIFNTTLDAEDNAVCNTKKTVEVPFPFFFRSYDPLASSQHIPFYLWYLTSFIPCKKFSHKKSVAYSRRWPPRTFLTLRKTRPCTVIWLTLAGKLVLRAFCYSISLLKLALYKIPVPLLSRARSFSRCLPPRWKNNTMVQKLTENCMRTSGDPISMYKFGWT